jgi:hypothetical protein
MEVAIYNISGAETGKKATLNDEIFGIEPNNHAIYLDVKQYLDNFRKYNIPLIATLSQGVHTLTVAADSQDELEAIRDSLKEGGFLIAEGPEESK